MTIMIMILVGSAMMIIDENDDDNSDYDNDMIMTMRSSDCCWLSPSDALSETSHVDLIRSRPRHSNASRTLYQVTY